MAYILIIDSQAEFRRQLSSEIEKAGHRAVPVATVSEGAGILDTGAPPDLLATDVVLTDGSSTQLAKRAAALGVKILMMTGNPDRIIEFDAAGQAYLSKPFPAKVFLRRVEELFAGS